MYLKITCHSSIKFNKLNFILKTKKKWNRFKTFSFLFFVVNQKDKDEHVFSLYFYYVFEKLKRAQVSN